MSFLCLHLPPATPRDQQIHTKTMALNPNLISEKKETLFTSVPTQWGMCKWEFILTRCGCHQLDICYIHTVKGAGSLFLSIFRERHPMSLIQRKGVELPRKENSQGDWGSKWSLEHRAKSFSPRVAVNCPREERRNITF